MGLLKGYEKFKARIVHEVPLIVSFCCPNSYYRVTSDFNEMIRCFMSDYLANVTWARLLNVLIRVHKIFMNVNCLQLRLTISLGFNPRFRTRRLLLPSLRQSCSYRFTKNIFRWIDSVIFGSYRLKMSAFLEQWYCLLPFYEIKFRGRQKSLHSRTGTYWWLCCQIMGSCIILFLLKSLC